MMAMLLQPPQHARRGQLDGGFSWLCCGSSTGAEAEQDAPCPTHVLRLNVGGISYTTSRETLAKSPKGSLLWKLAATLPGQGVCFVDRDGLHFHHVLNFLREGSGKFSPPADPSVRQELLTEAVEMGIHELAQLLAVQGGPAFNPGAHVGAAVPANEQERLARLSSLDIWQSNEQQERYDNITRAVQVVLDAPVVVLSLIGADYMWFKSKVGLASSSATRNSSFCPHMLLPEKPSLLVVEDALRHPQFKAIPYVAQAPHFRFYAGCPLVTVDGLRIGSLCVCDTKPRDFTQSHAQVLANFAQLAVEEMQRKFLTANDSKVPEDLENASGIPTPDDFAAGPRRAERARASLSELVLLVQVDSASSYWPILYANHVFSDITGMGVSPPAWVPGKPGDAGKQHLSLWEAVRTRQKELQDVVQDVRSAWEDNGAPVMFALSVTLPTAGGKQLPASCRFMPAQRAKDLAAASIRLGEARPVDDETPPDFSANGPLYFVTMTIEEEEPKPPPKKTLRKKGSTTFSDGGSDLPGRVPFDEGPEGAQPVVQRRKVKRRTPAFPNAPMGRSPFPDVQLLEFLGEGPFGPIYFGLWTGTPVHVKIIEWKGRANRRSIDEALEPTCAHPNVVQTYKHCTRPKPAAELPKQEITADLKFAESFPCPSNHEEEVYETWIVQEWCDGGSLDHFCTTGKRAMDKIPELLEICAEIAKGGTYLHSKGKIHGQLAADCILIKRRASKKGYVCKISDFGLSEVWQKSGMSGSLNSNASVRSVAPPEILSAGALGGPPTPEQTKKVDIYAAGIILWQALLGQSPFQGLNPTEVVKQALCGYKFELPQDTPQIVVDLFDRCTASDPDERPDFNELVRCFSEVQATLYGAGAKGARTTTAT